MLRIIYLAILCTLVLSVTTGCSPSADTPVFDQNRAFDLLKKQVDIGPRYPGSPGQGACADLIVSQIKPYANDVTVQEFQQTISGKTIPLRNIIAKFNTSAKKWIILAAHWDTRPISDMEIDAAKRAKPILGANDGASGVAVLLELARMFGERKPDVGVMMVFFDGEDYAVEPPSDKTMFLGSKYFAKHLDANTKARVKYGILLDMVGDKNLDVHKESASLQSAPEVVDRVWDTAKTLGYEKSFIRTSQLAISDDHLPLIEAGVKFVDIIDFNYGSWHTLDDMVDKCSAESLKIVGDVIAHVVYEEKGS